MTEDEAIERLLALAREFAVNLTPQIAAKRLVSAALLTLWFNGHPAAEIRTYLTRAVEEFDYDTLPPSEAGYGGKA